MNPAAKTAIEEGVKSIFPIESTERSLELTSVEIDTNKLDPNDVSKLKKLKIEEGTWGHPVYANLALKDKRTGKVLDESRMRIGTLPQETPHKTYLVNGTDYQHSSVQRLKPGAYTQKKDNDTFETRINPTKGRQLKIVLDPANQKYMLEIGSKNIPLYPLLRGLGISDREIEQQWGTELFNINKDIKQTPEKALRGFYKKTLGDNVPDDIEQVKSQIQEYMSAGKLDPFATKLTLKNEHTEVSAPFFLDASKKLLDVQQEKAEPDNPTDVYFQTFHNEETMLKERLRGLPPTLRRATAPKLNRARKVRDVFYPNKIREAIEHTYTTTQNSVASETNNLLDLVSADSVVTLKGPGGINSEHAIKPAARDLKPTSLGVLDPVKTPQGSAGVSVHTTMGSRLDGNELKTKVVDLKSGTIKEISSTDYANKTVAFPGEFTKNEYGRYLPAKPGKIMAVKNNEIVEVEPSKVDVLIPDAKAMFNEVTNLIPFLGANSGPRAMFGANQMTQAVPLKYRENRMVQTKKDGETTFDESIAQKFLPKSPVDGEVEEVTEGYISIKSPTGTRKVPIYKSHPLSHDSFIDSTPLVKPGDKVKSGQVLADNNYTKNGKLALGQNMVFALMPWKGYTYEDGVVVSETGARKLTSEHLRTVNQLMDDNRKLSKSMFNLYSPTSLTKENASKLDDGGLIKPGQKVMPGDVIATVVRKPRISKTDASLKRLGLKSLEWKAEPITWDHEFPGVVTDAKRVGDKVKVFIKTEEPAKVGDKISDSHGAKGVITKIIPDSIAPRRKADDKIIDVIVDPHGVPSRMNIGQIYELAAGKIAEKNKEPYLVENFSGEDYRSKLKADLEKNGIPDKESIVDPETGKEIPNINVGRKHIYKLKHQVDKKMGVRKFSDGYSVDEQPIDGKRLDRLSFYAMLGHGAKANLREMATVKATMDHDNYWAAIRNGDNFYLPNKPTFAYEKFDAMLKSLGVKTERKGSVISMMPMTDAEIRKLAPRKILRPDAKNKTSLRPVVGGLFDNEITGGMDGRYPRFSRIELPEAIPNPLFEKPIKLLLGLDKKTDIAEIVAGSKELNGETGGEVIRKALANIDIDKEIKDVEDAVSRSRNRSKKSEFNARLRYLRNLKELNISPDEAYTLKNIPVMPPNMRPIITLPGGSISPADINYHYRNMVYNSTRGWKKAQTVVEETGNKEVIDRHRNEIYQGAKALMGLDSADERKQRSQDIRDKKGILENIVSDNSPKYGFYQRKVMYSPQELSSRAVITADPTLDVDEVGYPEEIAWTQYEPFIHRRLRQKGMNNIEIRKSIKNREPIARQALEAEVKDRPVIINRAPSWHRFNVMAMKPVLRPGKDLKVPNLPINKYFGGDFDGDAMQIHLPISDEAVREAKEMFPSKYLYKPGTRSGDDVKLMLSPEQSAVIGLNYLSSEGRNTRQKFDTKSQAIAAEKSGKIAANDVVTIGDQRTTVGKLLLEDVLPADMPITGEITYKTLTPYLNELAAKHGDTYAKRVNDLNRIGENYATAAGFSIGLDDLVDLDDKIQPMLQETKRKIALKPDNFEHRMKNLLEMRNEAEAKIPDMIPQDNAFGKMMRISGKGNPNQIRQVLGAGMLYENTTGNVVPFAVEAPYAKGLTPAQYFIQQIGARKGLIDRAVETSKPGEIGKQLMATNADRVVTIEDCGTTNGVSVNIEKNPGGAYDHLLAEGNGVAAKNAIITTSLAAEMLKNNISEVKVRSPLRCRAATGICQKCYGLNERGKFPDIGENVGIQETQAIVERSANFTLKSWHTSGVSEKKVNPFDRYQELVQLPDRISNQAAVSTVTGKIDRIEKNPVSGYDVYVSGRRHTVPGNVSLLNDRSKANEFGVAPVVVGSSVNKGDRLSTGNIRPQDLLDYKGIEPAQEYITNELHGLMKDFGIRPKTVETVVSGMTNLAEIKDPGDSGFSQYDTAQVGTLREYNRNLTRELNVEEALGKRLAEPVAGFNIGDEVTPDALIRLKRNGIRSVRVSLKPAQYSPILKPVATYPLAKQEDWLANLDFTYLKKTIQEGAARGFKSDIHGHNPVSAFAYGAEFGKNNKPGGY